MKSILLILLTTQDVGDELLRIFSGEMSLILYGTEDFTLNKSEFSSLDFVINSLFTNLFKTNSIDAIGFFFSTLF